MSDYNNVMAMLDGAKQPYQTNWGRDMQLIYGEDLVKWIDVPYTSSPSPSDIKVRFVFNKDDKFLSMFLLTNMHRDI
jgi:hypothetical protein